jgi:hypothetical protein
MKKPTTTTSFDFVLSWMKTAEQNAKHQGRNDAAQLWKDAIEHLVYLDNENKCLTALVGRYAPLGKITKEDMDWAKDIINR